ncbi:MAG: polymerase subunit beta [Gammaproteobacteria bacterium]|jgi:predicted nucleotidyltransferase|nr:polymerase subunit beta [Gammaproteobacteria bacterium]
MASLVENRRMELEQVCRRFGIRRLELFGSAARNDFTPASDLDFLVEFSGSPSLDDYLGLRESLKSLFGREVDLVMPKAIRNPYVRASIERDRQLLYAA